MNCLLILPSNWDHTCAGLGLGPQLRGKQGPPEEGPATLTLSQPFREKVPFVSSMFPSGGVLVQIRYQILSAGAGVVGGSGMKLPYSVMFG